MRYTEKIKKPIKLRKERSFDTWAAEDWGSKDWLNWHTDPFTEIKTETTYYDEKEKAKPDFSKLKMALDECEAIIKDLTFADEAIEVRDYVFAITQIYKTKFERLRREFNKVVAEV